MISLIPDLCARCNLLPGGSAAFQAGLRLGRLTGSFEARLTFFFSE